jgi:hypothetical protein
MAAVERFVAASITTEIKHSARQWLENLFEKVANQLVNHFIYQSNTRPPTGRLPEKDAQLE